VRLPEAAGLLDEARVYGDRLWGADGDPGDVGVGGVEDEVGVVGEEDGGELEHGRVGTCDPVVAE
jgi:hypothetical protein